jgi:hypothetical protein
MNTRNWLFCMPIVLLAFVLGHGLEHLHLSSSSALVSPPARIKAEDFELVNKTGAVVARLGTDEHGEAELSMYDQSRVRRASLFLEPNGTPDLYFWDAGGHGTLALDLRDNGYGNLALLEPDGKHAVFIDYGKEHTLAVRSVLIRDGGAGVENEQTLKLFSGRRGGIVLEDSRGQILWKSDSKKRP